MKAKPSECKSNAEGVQIQICPCEMMFKYFVFEIENRYSNSGTCINWLTFKVQLP